ncbi:class I SAM-dependent methyltransferase [Qipengyuania sp. 1NDH17]|uniref:Class I SAM-dependent methyltransferase n=1 Tax=Qipengyuania polymorpha TaxID=2867234 RepID=A0ABS7IXP3_9SPHN|nr:class I SAM-dependent methyltransferase [Qipengyuania polymorpha]
MSSPDIYDPTYVRDVFDRCADQYIAFSNVCSLGFTQIWRSQCAEMLDLLPEHQQGYDFMAGTGEVWPHLLAKWPQVTSIHAVDISSGMHQKAMKRLHAMRAHKIEFREDDVLQSGLPDESAEFVISTFGLKTFKPEQHERLAKLTERVLRPGGRFAYIEASDPTDWWLRPLYRFHLDTILPQVERFLLKGAQDFAMIGEYSANFGNAREFARMLGDTGLNTEYREFFFGCASGVCGSKPC